MEDWTTPLTSKTPENPIYRWIHRLMLKLVIQFLRLAGWGAVVGLPAMILGPQRCTRLVKRFPIAAGASCLSMLVCVALWSDSSHSRPTELEIESIDHFDDPIELLAKTTTSAATASQPVSDSLPNKPIASTATEVDGNLRAANHPTDTVVTTVARFGPETQTSDSDGVSKKRAVWLTGQIEDEATSEPVEPVRNAAVRSPSNRR